MQNKISLYIQLLRPHQYLKNLFIFLPLFFSLKIHHTDLLFNAFIAFVAFSLSASSVYIFNDYIDKEADKKHPLKKERPLASGKITPTFAIRLMLALSVSGTLLMATLSYQAALIVIAYMVLNIAYSLKLKHLAIIDITIIAVGFVLRVFIGTTVTNLETSMWIIVMTFLLALFLALAKRRDDVLIFQKTGKKMRKVIDGYNLIFVDTAMTLMSGVVIVAYLMYCVSPDVIARTHSHNLYFTLLFVIIGILRYMQLTLVEEISGSPTNILLKDKMIQFSIFGWIMTFIMILY